MTSREIDRKAFLRLHGLEHAQIIPLVPDASFRQYFRVSTNGQTFMLMDAPKEHEKPKAFVNITQHLDQLGIATPGILEFDLDKGFILLEDLGDHTFTRLIKSSTDEQYLYSSAIDILIALHSYPDGINIPLDEYDFNYFLDEVNLFINWYLPAQKIRYLTEDTKQDFELAWKQVYDQLPDLDPVLVLRDFHIDNLMQFNNRIYALDYQDALIGSPAYDLVSLLEDARRDVPEKIQSNGIKKYFSNITKDKHSAFQHHYTVWGAQRHCKVAGIFTRLWLRDGKDVYLQHLRRTMRQFSKKLSQVELKPVARWFRENGYSLEHSGFNKSREEILCELGET